MSLARARWTRAGAFAGARATRGRRAGARATRASRAAGEGGDGRFSSESERRAAIDRLSPPKDDGTGTKTTMRSMSERQKFGGGMAEEGAREKDERARRRARAERRREKKRAEASDMMRAMREEIEREESVRRLMVRVDSGEETEPTDIARAAAAAFERLERRYGKLSSLFAVLSWMNDFVDDEVDAAVGSEEEARARGEEGAVARDGSREPKRRASDDVPSGLLGSISNALREWFSIDITELEDGRKEVVVNASAEFLVLFVVLVVASSKFGGDLVAAVLTPDPLLR